MRIEIVATFLKIFYIGKFDEKRRKSTRCGLSKILEELSRFLRYF